MRGDGFLAVEHSGPISSLLTVCGSVFRNAAICLIERPKIFRASLISMWFIFPPTAALRR